MRKLRLEQDRYTGIVLPAMVAPGALPQLFGDDLPWQGPLRPGEFVEGSSIDHDAGTMRIWVTRRG